jgi:hypothetical protein
MKKNVGNTDMVVRLLLAVILLLLYFLKDFRPLPGLIILILAVLLGVTAFAKFCPLYYVFRANTLKKENKE